MMLDRVAAAERALEGRVAVVTGGNSGIGAATARAFAAAGAHVAILARREVEGRSVEAELRAAGSRAIFVACDVTRRDDIERAVEAVVSTYGGADVLFNNAGGAEPDPFPALGGDAAWERALALNLTSAYVMTGVLWPLLTAAPDASIINMSSTAAVMAASPRMLETARFFPPVGYWAAKAGIEALTRYTAAYGAAFGIRANAVRPGQILTPLSTRNTPGKHFADAMFAESQITPGAGTAEDVAGAVCFLASPAARFINAHVLDVDGGWVAKV